MSFRKNRNKTGEDDMPGKVSYAKDSEPPEPAAQQEQAQPTEQAQQEEPSGDDSSGDEEPPDGTTAEILRWVGGDKARAQAALDKEQADDRPRSGLTRELNEILAK